MPLRRLVVVPLVVLSGIALAPSPGVASRQPSALASPRAALLDATEVRFTGDVDSNTPAVWMRLDGQQTFIVITSIDGQLSRATGSGVTSLGAPAPVSITPWPGGGVWM